MAGLSKFLGIPVVQVQVLVPDVGRAKCSGLYGYEAV